MSGFVQDDIALIPDRLRLTLGVKLEHNDHTENELQPNLRLLWQMNRDTTFWAAISRALGTPRPQSVGLRLRRMESPTPISRWRSSGVSMAQFGSSSKLC